MKVPVLVCAGLVAYNTRVFARPLALTVFRPYQRHPANWSAVILPAWKGVELMTCRLVIGLSVLVAQLFESFAVVRCSI